MKIVTILGSARTKGNTAKVLASFEKLVGGKHTVDRINVASYDVGGCLGCGKCRENSDEPGCVQQDDAMQLFDLMMAADLIVYATPLYCWTFPAQIKALIDRHYCLVKAYGTPDSKSFLEGKRDALLVTCDGPRENNADLIEGVFDRFSAYCKFKIAGKYVLPFCGMKDGLDTRAAELAGKMAGELAGLTSSS
jgi:multimeric flavodoxin WrbA